MIDLKKILDLLNRFEYSFDGMIKRYASEEELEAGIKLVEAAIKTQETVIEIYAVDQETRLVAVAPLSQRDAVEKRIAKLNVEAAEAKVSRRYKYNVSSVQLWNPA